MTEKIIFNNDELNQELILNEIKKEIDSYRVDISKEDKKLIMSHSYAQVENLIDKIAQSDFSLLNDTIDIPVYEVNEDGYIIFKDSILKNSKIKYTKESILGYIKELSRVTARYGTKGVIASGNR